MKFKIYQQTIHCHRVLIYQIKTKIHSNFIKITIGSNRNCLQIMLYLYKVR